MEKPLVIYHGNCADGFGAAWVFKTRAKFECEFLAGVYQTPPPDVTGRAVYLVDFSYKRETVEKMLEQSLGITLIDHHKTAIEDLDPLIKNCSIEAYTDMDKSGATLAWEYLHDGNRIHMPKLLEHIEDRDLWKFLLPKTREIQANIFSHPYDFDVWSKLMETDPAVLAIEGAAIERKHHKDIAELLAVCKRRITIAGYTVWGASLPYTLTSDAGHAMAVGEPFAVCYWDTPETRVFSLRSTEEGIDVSEIAKKFGGGGHKHAAGFSVSRNHPLAMV